MIWPQSRSTRGTGGGSPAVPRCRIRIEVVKPLAESLPVPVSAAPPSAPRRARVRVALLSNPKSTGNLAQLPRIREYCAAHPDIFHYEVEEVDQIGAALASIAAVRPKMLIVNGGDGTVQAALTELIHGGQFDGLPLPPVAVLPSGKTNLIALDLGAQGDPVAALARYLDMARDDFSGQIAVRELISLSGGADDARPVIGMFLGGAGLADIMLYCRHRIYPLGLSNGLSHAITAIAVVLRYLVGLKASFLPPSPGEVSLKVAGRPAMRGRFSLLFVTTLDKLLLSGLLGTGEPHRGSLKMVAIEQGPLALAKALVASLRGRLGQRRIPGVHVHDVAELAIEGDSGVILDGETFRAAAGKPLLLRPAQPLSFIRLAA